MVISILMLLSFGFLVFSLLRRTDSFTKLVWLPVAILVAISIVLLFYGITSFIGVGFSPVLTVAINCIAAFAIWLYYKKAKSESRRVRLGTREDIISIAILVVLSICVFGVQFGWPGMFNFETTDPAVHLSASLDIYEGRPVTGQYSTYVVCACFIALISPFAGLESTLLSFLLSETFLFLVSGLMFYSVLAIYCPSLGWIARSLLCACYLVGYPLNNMIFGFSYWGFSVTIICALFFIAKAYAPEKMKCLVLLATCLFDLMISYSLFVPVTYLAVFVWLLGCSRKAGASLADIFKSLFIVFLLPVILGFVIVYLSIFGASGVGGVGSAINNIGYSYKNLFSAFIPIAPLSIYGVVVNKRENSFLVLFGALFLAFSLLLLLFGMMNFVSAYYFSKIYAVMWLVFFVFGAMGIQALKEKNIAMLASYSAVWLLVLFLAVSGVDNKISDARREFSPTPTAWSFFPLYEFNLGKLPHDEGDADYVELFRQAQSYGRAGIDYEIFGSDFMSNWSMPLLGNETPLAWWRLSKQEVLDKLLGFDYVMMGASAPESLTTTDGISYEEVKNELLQYYEPLYSNGVGEIYARKQVPDEAEVEQ